MSVSEYLCSEKRPKQDPMCLFDEQTDTAHNLVLHTNWYILEDYLSSYCVILKDEDVH